MQETCERWNNNARPCLPHLPPHSIWNPLFHTSLISRPSSPHLFLIISRISYFSRPTYVFLRSFLLITLHFNLFFPPTFPTLSLVSSSFSLDSASLSFLPLAALFLPSLISYMYRSSCLRGNQTVGVFNTADVLDGWEDKRKRLKVGITWTGVLWGGRTSHTCLFSNRQRDRALFISTASLPETYFCSLDFFWGIYLNHQVKNLTWVSHFLEAAKAICQKASLFSR